MVCSWQEITAQALCRTHRRRADRRNNCSRLPPPTRLHVQDASYFACNVGIGTTNSATTLHVVGTGRCSQGVSLDSTLAVMSTSRFSAGVIVDYSTLTKNSDTTACNVIANGAVGRALLSMFTS